MGIKDWRPSQGITEEDAWAFSRYASDHVSHALGVPIGFVPIPSGTFLMGSDENPNERPVHEVTLTRWIWMQETTVTQAQWQAVMGKNPSDFKGLELPVESVSWDDCQGFIEKLNNIAPGQLFFDLPTEAEWEYACRAGSVGKWCFGDDERRLKEYAWYDANSGKETHPVGQKKPNAWGLYDMHGNVWEWCLDWYSQYKPGAQADPAGPFYGKRRVLRGGGWNSYSWNTRSANRIRIDPSDRGYDVGVRLVLR